jgi:hypothetical protein
MPNLHFGVRGLLRNPGLALTVLLTLALGIGATTAIFTIDYASLNDSRAGLLSARPPRSLCGADECPAQRVTNSPALTGPGRFHGEP